MGSSRKPVGPFLQIRQETKGGTAGFAVCAGTCVDEKTSRFTATANLAEHAGNREDCGRRPRIAAGVYTSGKSTLAPKSLSYATDSLL